MKKSCVTGRKDSVSLLADPNALIVALTERHNLKRILTFDRRHFAMFRPKGREYLELLP